ncbi:MAG: 5'-methylthioadenosine/adenosylhomocysteine nucleosidase [Victivallales bacterium]|nr:5'-methylthioadenosine/adenosylhomocysteine nucleosidase [Victivallales bacterium]
MLNEITLSNDGLALTGSSCPHILKKLKELFLLLMVPMVSCSTLQAQEQQPANETLFSLLKSKAGKNAPLAIIGAEKCEVQELIDALKDAKEEKHSDRCFHIGKLEGQNVVIVECGVGKVNSARTTQMLIDFYTPWAIINTGVGGGLAPGLKIGDIILGEKLVQHDFDVSPLGYVPGQIIGLSTEKKPTYFLGDKAILAALKAAVASVAKDRNVRLGCIASGDVFVSKGNLKQVLHDNFGADVAEMEGASIAHVASTANVPFAVIRAVSDLADGSAPASFAEFDAEASHIAAQAVRKFCQQLK